MPLLRHSTPVAPPPPRRLTGFTTPQAVLWGGRCSQETAWAARLALLRGPTPGPVPDTTRPVPRCAALGHLLRAPRARGRQTLIWGVIEHARDRDEVLPALHVPGAGAEHLLSPEEAPVRVGLLQVLGGEMLRPEVGLELLVLLLHLPPERGGVPAGCTARPCPRCGG